MGEMEGVPSGWRPRETPPLPTSLSTRPYVGGDLPVGRGAEQALDTPGDGREAAKAD